MKKIDDRVPRHCERDDIEITPEMIAAGEYAFGEYNSRFEFPADAVARIYRAMRQLEP